MKKVLYGTTALLAAGMISSAANAAEPISLSLGGYMDWYVASANQDSDYLEARGANGQVNNFEVMGDGEIYVMGDTTLDNGIKVGVQVEIEGGNESEDDPIDESYVTVDTSYGRIEIGSTDNVAEKMHVGAKDVGRLGVRESDLANLILVPAGGDFDRINSTALNTDEDAQKISYVTPTYYGLTLGASWIPGPNGGVNNDNQGEDASLLQNDFEEGYAFGAMYSNEFQGIGVTLSGGYANYNVGGDERRDEVSGGLELTYMDFTLGGSYRKVNDPQFNDMVYVNDDWVSGRGATVANGVDMDLVDGTINNAGEQDGYAWDLSVAYEAGPYGVSLAYMKSSVEGDQAVGVDGSAARAADINNNEDEVDMYLLSGKYSMGAGVDTFASFGYMDYDDEVDDTSVYNGNDDHNDGWAFVTGLALAF